MVWRRTRSLRWGSPTWWSRVLTTHNYHATYHLKIKIPCFQSHMSLRRLYLCESDHTPQTFVEACITDHWVHATASLPALNFSPPTPNSTSSCSTCATPHPDMSIFSWDRLEASCLFSPAYTFLHKVISAEVSE